MTNPTNHNFRQDVPGSSFASGTNVPPIINHDQRLTVRQVASLLGVGVSTIWKMCSVDDGRLPPPERYGSRCSRWRYASVLEALEKMQEASR